MNSFMDRTVNPCDNFYEYACGNWMKGSLIPDDEPEVTVYTQMQEEVRIVLKSRSASNFNFSFDSVDYVGLVQAD